MKRIQNTIWKVYNVIGLKITYSVFIKRVESLSVFFPQKCDNTNLLYSDNTNFLSDNSNFLCDNPNLLGDNLNLLYDNTNLLSNGNPNFLCDNTNSLCLRLIDLLSANRNWEVFFIYNMLYSMWYFKSYYVFFFIFSFSLFSLLSLDHIQGLGI